MYAKELCEKAKTVADCFHTVYMKGVFGAPLTPALIKSKTAQYPDWYTAARVAEFSKLAAREDPTFGFDCVCLLKALLWGWKGDPKQVYGGAVYGSNGVPDLTVEGLVGVCSASSKDFSEIEPGELLYLPGHVGLYLGNGLAVECTPVWEGGVQITGVTNVGYTGGYHGRKWSLHCRLPYVEYEPLPPESLPTLRRGNKTEAVRAMQALLLLRGYSVGECGTDGSFGGDTLAALRRFQQENGLPLTGICAESDWLRLIHSGKGVG